MKKKIGLVLSLAALFISLFITTAFATTVTVLDGQVSVSDTANTLSDSGTMTATAKGSLLSKAENTITITNNSGSTAELKFDYSVSSSNSFTIDGVSAATSGNITKTLESGASVVLYIQSKSGFSGTTVTLTLSNFSLTIAAASSNVAFDFDSSLGSVTVAGVGVADGDVKEIALSGAALVATPKSGATFLGWVDADGKIMSTAATYTLQPATDMTVIAAFASASSTAWFKVGSYMYDDLNDAATYASSSTNKVIIPMHDGTLPAGNYTIPTGVTLLIPYDSANTLCTTEPSFHENAYTTPSVYRTLTMANGASITVNGAISVSGSQSSKYKYNGMPSGPLGFINMNSGSSITVESGGAIYAWGYITGAGNVSIKNGGTVYECFQIADYRGGDATSAIVGKDDDYGVFPFNQYYLQNVEVPMTLYAGAKEYGYSSVQVTLAGRQSMEVPFIGASDSMFAISSGYIVKDYVEGKGRTDIKVYGDLSVAEITIEMKVSLIGNIKIETSKYALPIPHHFTVSVESGGITMNQSIAFLPGSEFTVKSGTTCTLGSGKKVYIYDLDQWLYNNGANGYSGTGNVPYINIPYVPGGNGTTGRLKDAQIQIDGTVDASTGSVYVTEGGANIYSTGSGVVKTNPGTDTIVYQVITNDTDIGSWPEIPIAPAQLHNGGAENKYSGTDDEYTATAGTTAVTTYNHCPDCLMWYTGSHTCAAAATYSVTITWNQTSTAVYTPTQTTYTWSPTDLKYTASTTQGKWTDTSVMTIAIDNSKSTGAVTAEFVYAPIVTGDTAWTGLTDNALSVAAGGNGNVTLTVAPAGTPTKPTSGNEVVLGTVTITLRKEE